MEADKKWYVIHTYSGYENKVKTTLELKVQSMGLQDVISWILVPLEDEIDEKDYLVAIKTILEKITPTLKGLKEYQKKQKIIKYLLSKGYEYDLIVNEI